MEARMKAFDINVDRWLFCFTHPDDEISIVAWIRRLCKAGRSVHCCWSVSNAVREMEARRMLTALGVPDENLHFYDAPDGHACDRLADLILFYREAIRVARPQRIAVGAFECGHIDHDSTNFAVAHANEGDLPIFEIPFYHTYLTRIPVINRFADPKDEQVIELTDEEARIKVNASRAYPSQNIGRLLYWYTVLNIVKLKPAALCSTERMRLQSHFDFTSPNLPEPLRNRVAASEKFRRFVKSQLDLRM
jgi:LmbE family N-acetylglucosaminyl deacetylase